MTIALLVCGCLIIVLFIVAPFWHENHLALIDETVRQKARGNFVRLSKGITHYEWIGAQSASTVVCIHGLTTPSYVWHGIAPQIAALGHHVLLYDIFGRGYSDRPPDLQDRAFFLQQLHELLDSQKVTNNIVVIGFSMGGAIATAFTAENPKQVKKLVLIAPAGLKVTGMSTIRQMMVLPAVGGWFARGIYRSSHRKGTEAERHLPSSVPGIVDRQQQELNYQGFCPSVLASVRGLLHENQSMDHEKIAGSKIPTLAIFGENDAVISPGCGSQLVASNPDARVEIVAGAGHGLPYTHSDEILCLLSPFLSDRRAE
ncbi:MAG: alpha/beta hydrolase [Aestuariivita sp.]|nr:alpha/beta hydrolase [Aestuariivita sp.]MCY4201269.1 alpha/beta hydrolase [Aestuariivita sp.]